MAMETFAAVIDAWPSPAEFAADVGVPLNNARVWKHRDSIPARYWPQVVAGAEARGLVGITLDLLAKLAARERPSTPADEDGAAGPAPEGSPRAAE